MPSAEHSRAAAPFRLVLLSLPMLVCPAAAEEAARAQTPWRYVTPEAGQEMEHAPFRPVLLTEERPDDLSEAVSYRGARRLYAQLRYGSPGSTRVTVVVDETGPGAFDLYVDRDRNRTIEPDELLPGAGAVRRLPLSVEDVREGILDRSPRSVILRRGSTGKTLGIATVGYFEGEADLDGRRVKVRRVDGDGNGLFADLRDRLWIDRNGDGKWDPFAEQFPHLPVLRLDGRRFAVRAGAAGDRLAFEEVVGVGRLTVRLPPLPEKARVRAMQVMFLGEDGSAFTVRGDEPATLPVGRYALGSVSLSVLDGEAPEPWNFVFSSSGFERPRRWYEVAADGEVTVDPVGKFRFELELPDGAVRPGQELRVSPRLYTGDGLRINSSACGELEPFASPDRYNCATVRLVSPSGGALSTAKSGFA